MLATYSRSQRGFTLIELMIVLTIVGIVSSFAYSSYSTNIIKTHRSDAQVVLMSFAAAMERHYISQGSYLGADNGDAADGNGFLKPGIFSMEAPIDGNVKYYDLRMIVTATTYSLFAIPKGTQAGDGNIRLTSTGQRNWDKTSNNTYSTGW